MSSHTAMVTRARSFQQTCRRNLYIDTKSDTRAQAIRTSPTLLLRRQRRFASTQPNRRAITVTTDDGRYNWSDLSTTEKAARTTQQSFNFLLIAAGAVGTITVSYFLYQELFAADSKTRQFNHAVDRIKADPRCRQLLGPSNKISAYGEPTSNKWARARPLAHSTEVDRLGVTHFRMHFHVEGPDGQGVVNVHMTKGQEDSELKYRVLSLNVPGHEVVYLENADAKSPKRAVGKMFGVQWK